ncbi:hypothetical protein ACTL6U_20610 [Rhodovibrionaceae bacterium A322]
MIYFFIYLLLSIAVGWMGRHKTIGFVGYFLLSIVVTPVVTFAILLMGAERGSSTRAKS